MGFVFFIGAIVLAGFLWLVILFIACLILFVFIPCLTIAIINLVKGIKNHWPLRNTIPLIITGSIATIFIVLLTMYFVWRFGYYQDPTATSSASQAANQLLFLIKL